MATIKIYSHRVRCSVFNVRCVVSLNSFSLQKIIIIIMSEKLEILSLEVSILECIRVIIIWSYNNVYTLWCTIFTKFCICCVFISLLFVSFILSLHSFENNNSIINHIHFMVSIRNWNWKWDFICLTLNYNWNDHYWSASSRIKYRSISSR